MQIELTKAEAEQLVQLIDLAVKSAGVQVARAAWTLTDKLVQAAQAEAAEASEPQAEEQDDNG